MELRNWTILFPREYGHANRRFIVADIANFLRNDAIEELIISGHCRACGFVYGHKEISDEEGVITSEIARIHRTRKFQRDTEFELYTQSGSCYHVSLGNMSINMRLIFDDWFKTGNLNEEDRHYSFGNNAFEDYL